MKQKLLSIFLVCVLVASAAFAQDKRITGKVTAREDGLPLPGVSIKVSGTQIGTQTDANGNYSLNVPSTGKNLEFSFIGFLNQSVSIGTKSAINISLDTDEKQLSEVIVTGYGTTTREKFTGAASTVLAKNIEQVPIASFDQILQGRAPGVQINAGSGQPGANNTSVIIRGQGSINGGNGPIYILDGIPIESSVFSTMNPNDFESVTILKDASSTAPYGSRGANGVIVISSKKGKAGRTNITYRTQTGFSNRTQPNFEMMTTAQRLEYELELGRRGVNVGFPGWTLSKENPTYATQTAAVQGRRDFQLDSISNINTDWTDIFFRTGQTQQHELNINGGSEKTKFFTSASYFNQEGIAIRSKLERFNFRANLDHTSGRFSLSVQSAAGFSKSSGVESENAVALANPFAAVYLARPYENPYIYNGRIGTNNPGATNNPLGLTNIGMFGNPLLDGRVGSNAFDRIFNTKNNFNQFKGTLGITSKFKITDYLTAKSTTGFDLRETNNTGFINPASFAGISVARGNQGQYNENFQRNFKLINTSGLEFNKVFNTKHSVGGQALFEYIYDGFKNFSYTGYGINPKLPNTPAGTSAGTATNNFIPLIGGRIDQRSIFSLIALGNYTYDSKYTLDASIRRDGSSLLPVQNRYRNFYSVGGSWNANKENFLKNLEFLSLLKVRASYGVAANAEGIAADFGYLPAYSAINYAGSPAIAPGRPADPNYDWEFTHTANIGLDVELFKSRVRGYMDIYDRRTKNVFVSEGLSATTGFGSLTKNAGEVQNKGIELSLGGDIISNKNVTWTVDFNFGYNVNEVLNLGGVNEFESGTSIIRVGLPLGSHYTVQNGGVNPTNGDQLWVNRDGTKTTDYSASQSVANFGSFRAPLSGGFSSSLRYKGFDASAFFTFVSDFYRFNNEVFFLTNSGQSQFGQLAEQLTDSWKKPGDLTRYPRFGLQRQFNSDDIEDASFLRLRNVVLGYNIPKSIIGKSKFLQNVRITAQAQNLYTWTKWRGFDPEDNNNIAAFEFPAPRTYTFGLDVTF